MLTQKEITSLRKIVEILNDRELYLYGEGFRNRCLGDTEGSLSVLVYATPLEYDSINKLIAPFEESFKFSFSDNINKNIERDIYIIDTLHINVKKILEENDGTVQSVAPYEEKALQNLYDRELAFTSFGYEQITKKPYLILDSVVLASQHGLTFEFESMKHIFNNRHIIKNIDINRVYNFLLNIFYKSYKIRKGVAFINTLGISLELFDCNLVENSVLNHLNKKDIFEFFTIIFSNVPVHDLPQFLINKVGFKPWDIKDIINETNAINLVSAEDDQTAREILTLCGKTRFYNLIRLFKLLGFKTLSKKLKEQKDCICSVTDLDLTSRDIKMFFDVDDEQANKALELALEYAILQPELNEKNQLLILLNKEIESVKHV